MNKTKLAPLMIFAGVLIFAAGLTVGILLAPAVSRQTPSGGPDKTATNEPVEAVAGQQPEAASVEPAVIKGSDFYGFISEVLADGLVVSLPDLPGKDGKPSVARLIIDGGTKLEARVQGTTAATADSDRPKKGEKNTGSQMPTDIPTFEPRKLSDFQAGDYVSFVTSGSPLEQDTVPAISVTLLRAAEAVSPPADADEAGQ